MLYATVVNVGSSIHPLTILWLNILRKQKDALHGFNYPLQDSDGASPLPWLVMSRVIRLLRQGSRPERPIMSGTEHSKPPDGVTRQKVDKDDHDLLTFGEVGERLRVEIASLTARVAALAGGGNRDELDKAETRLAALRAAAKRNAAQPINDSKAEGFFG